MSRKLSEQDLYALFDQLNTDDMPSGMVSRIEQRVLAEVNSTLQPGVVTAGRGSGWFATMFSNIRMPSLQLLPSFAMGAAAAVVILVLMLNPELINRLIGIEGPQTGAPGETVVVPTLVPTDTPPPIPTATVADEIASADDVPVAVEATPTAIETPSLMPESPTSEAEAEDSQPQPTVESDASALPDEPASSETDELLVPAYPVPGVSQDDATQLGGDNSNSVGETGGDEPDDVATAAPTLTWTATTEAANSNVAQLPLTFTVTPESSEEGANGTDGVTIATATATRQTQSVGTATGSQTVTPVPTMTSTRAIGTATQPSGGIQRVTPTKTATPVTSGTTAGQITTPSPTPSLTPTTVIPTRTPSRTPTTIPTSTDDVEGNDGSGQPVITRVPTKTKTPTKTPTGSIVIRPVTATSIPKDTSTPVPTLTPTGTNTPSSTKTPTPTETVNHPPEAADYTVELFEDGDVTFNLRENISDPDGDSVSISIMKEPSHGLLNLQNGSIIRYQPERNFNGKDFVLVQVTDSNGLGDVGTVTFSVAPVNDLPEAVSDNYQVEEDGQIIADVLANDSDPDGDDLSIVSVGEPTHGSVTIVDGKLTYVPKLNFHGDDSFTYIVNDGVGQVSSVVNIQVVPSQDPPSAVDDTFVINEDTVTVLNVLRNDFDVDGDPLQITEVFNVSAGAAEIINEGTEIRYTPAKNASGSAQLSYRITDRNDTDVALVAIQINPVPDAPQAVDDVIATEDNRQIPIKPLENDIDVDGDILTLAGIITPPTNGVAEIQADNTILYTPNSNFDGSDVITYSVRDASGRTSQARITVNVTAVNLPPVAVPDAITGPEDQPLSLNVLANDTDPDGDTLQITSVTESSNGTITVDGASLILVPNPNFAGVIEVTYGISDGNSTAQAVATFTVTPVQDAPTAQDDLGAGLEDTPITVPVLQNDNDVDGDALSIVTIGAPSFGTATKTADERGIIYTPMPNFFGSDSFTYTISDGNANATATVQITVNPVNDPPAVPDKNVSMPEDTTAGDDISFIDVLEGVADPEGDTLTIARISQQPSHGKATIVDNQVQYVPEANFNGQDIIKVEISDGGPALQEVAVTIEVTALPDPPVAVNDEFPILEDPAAPVSLDVLANDIDPETGSNSSLVIVGASQPAGDHQVTLNENNALTFIPAADKSGVVTFTYKIVSNQGSGEATGLVTINIDPINDAPKAIPDVAQVDAGSAAILINVLANDIDIDSPREALILGLPEQGIADLTIVDNQISYQPPPGFSGTVNVIYTVTDQKSPPVNGTLTITVLPTTDAPPGGASNPPGEDGNTDSNDNQASENTQAPIADPVTVSSNGEAVTVDVIGSQTGLTVSVDPSVVGGTASVQGSSIMITPTQGYTGIFNVGYNLSNGITTTSSLITVTVSVATAP